MNPQRAGAAALFAALLLLAQPLPRTAASPQQRRAATTQKESVIFIVTKEADGAAQVEPFAVFNRRGTPAAAAFVSVESGENAMSVFFDRYYRPGSKYRLIFGGAEAGSVTIREPARAECAPVAAYADLDTATAKLGGNVMALATDGPYELRAQASRRAASADERAAVFRLVKSALARKGVGAAAVERATKTLNLTATDLDGDGREELIGSYVVKTGPKTRDTLFLVAAPRGARGYGAALTKHARVGASELMDPSLIDNLGEGGLGTELFVEQFDVSGDGVGEVFTMSRSFEGTTYRAYRRARGVWRAAYENYSYRCAY